MYGAILGDIIGSPFEFDRGDKTKKFVGKTTRLKLFLKKLNFFEKRG
jgi:ADP-ribosylglycohydrolase